VRDYYETGDGRVLFRNADARQHSGVRSCVGGHGGVAAFGLKVGELSDEDGRLALGVIDHRRSAHELHARVVAGRHAVLGG
jgi:hypothetical protein